MKYTFSGNPVNGKISILDEGPKDSTLSICEEYSKNGISANWKKSMERRKKTGLFTQVYILIIISIVIIGVVTAVSQYIISERRVRAETDILAEAAAGEVISSIKEYPAYRWLLTYWTDHAEELDVQYDVDYSKESPTGEKVRLLQKKHPDMEIRYCSEEEVLALSAEDQKLYAEIVYSWLSARMNGIKQNFGCDFLYCAVTDIDSGEQPYEYELYLFSGANPDEVRGTEYGNVYTLGVTTPLQGDKKRQGYMRQAVLFNREHRSVSEKYDNPGHYIDYYTCLSILEDRAVLTGTSFSLQTMKRKILSAALVYSLNTIIMELLLLNLAMILISRFILKPLEKVLSIIRSYTETKDSRKSEKEIRALLTEKKGLAIRRNEVGQLAEDFSDLTREIEDYTKRIRDAVAVQKRMEFELETASVIQQQMLPDGAPDFPDHPEFRLGASMKPAKEVGGDFYDYFLVDDTHLVMVMADVSDKGVPAALFMAQARTLIRSRAQNGEDPEQILYYVNNQLNESNEKGFFVTVWLALLDLETGEGLAVNAGHEHPAICRSGKEFELVRYRHSLAAGIMENICFKQHTFHLDPGDRLFIYTDGVPEAQNSSSEQFGTDRMLDVLRKNQSADPASLLAAVTEAIDAFTGEAGQFDDTTMMCLHYIGRSNEDSSNQPR